MPFDGSTYQDTSLSHVDATVLRGKLYAERMRYAEAAKQTSAIISLLRDPNHWCKGVERLSVRHLYFFTKHRMCVLGAMKTVGCSGLVQQEIIRFIPSKYFDCIPNWNDDSETTHPDVLRVLRAVKIHFTARFLELDERIKSLA